MAKESESPNFLNPPVVETVLSVQFAFLPNFTSGHFGWFWKKFLDSKWVKGTDQPVLGSQFERFDDKGPWLPFGAQQFGVSSHHPDRFQITTAEEDRMIQVQTTRFIYNWRKKQGSYPRYKKIRPEFDQHYETFRRFVKEVDLGELNPNQWEIAYVNPIKRGDLWESPADWHKILPAILGPCRSSEIARFESIGGEWRFEIPPQKGRLHVNLVHGRMGSEMGEEVLTLTLLARGPVQNEAGLDAGLNFGHEAIVRTFCEITSPEAQAYWAR